MAIEETGSYVGDWSTTAANNKPTDNPGKRADGAAEIRQAKKILKDSFTGVTGAVTATHTELNYVDGVTSSVQDQLDALAVETGYFGNVTGAVTPTHTELNFVDGVTSNIQDQIDTVTIKAGFAAWSGLQTTSSTSFINIGDPVTIAPKDTSSPDIFVTANALIESDLVSTSFSSPTLRIVRDPSGTPVAIGTASAPIIDGGRSHQVPVINYDAGGAGASITYGLQVKVAVGTDSLNIRNATIQVIEVDTAGI